MTDDIYEARNVRALFDEMSKTYGITNVFASFGFAVWWRKVCLSKIRTKVTGTLIDMMTGMGENFGDLRRVMTPSGRIRAIDFSTRMCEGARENAKRLKLNPEIIEADVFQSGFPDACADVVVSTFGLKTFSKDQQAAFAKEVARVLKPGGEFALIEISVPRTPVLRFFYGFYLKRVIPRIGWLCMGNPDNYRYLGIYTEKFGNSQHFHEELGKCGLRSNYFEHFFGCASGVYGKKP